MSEPMTTARIARLGYVRELSRLLVRSMADHDVSQAQLAACTGRSAAIAQRWCDPERPEVPHVSDLPLLPQPVAIDLLRWMAGHHDHLVGEAPDATTIQDDLEHLAATVRECGEASSTFAHAISDGVITVEQAEAIIREASDGIQVLQAMVERARQVLESRGGKVRRMVPRGAME